MDTPRLPTQDADDPDKLLIAALEHLWTYFEARRTQRLQMINYFLLAVAFIAAAYVSALGNDLDTVATAIPIIGVGVTAGLP